MNDHSILVGDCVEQMRTMPDASVQCCVTSPPYWGLRDYGHDGQIGLEETPDEYVARLVEVFREVRRVLRDDGTLWLNMGDSYAGGPTASLGRNDAGNDCGGGGNIEGSGNPGRQGSMPVRHGLKPKDLVGIPWRVAFALQADGWYLRSDIIWAKPNPMPESVTDRPTKAHEYLFLLTKSARYFYDADAVREAASETPGALAWRRIFDPSKQIKESALAEDGIKGGNDGARVVNPLGRNKRTVWTVATQPFPGAHFAVMPPKLVQPCVRAGSKPGDIVIDPFAGAGTVGVVALQEGRRFIGCELNPEYAAMADERIKRDAAQITLFRRMGGE